MKAKDDDDDDDEDAENDDDNNVWHVPQFTFSYRWTQHSVWLTFCPGGPVVIGLEPSRPWSTDTVSSGLTSHLLTHHLVTGKV